MEKGTNPFLRLLEPDILQALRARTGLSVGMPSENFEAMRNWKDSF